MADKALMALMKYLRKAGLELDADFARMALEVVARTVIEAEVAEQMRRRVL